MDNNNQKHTKQNIALTARFLKGSWVFFIISILSAGITALADMLDPQIFRMAIDNAIGGAKPSYSAAVMAIVNRFGGFAYLGAHLWMMAVAIVTVAFLRMVAQYTFRVSSTKAAETLVKTMRDTLFSHIERLPFSWHMKNHTGDIIQRCTSDIDTTKNFVSEQLTAVFRILTLLVMSLVFMLSMDPVLTLIAIVPMPVIIIYSFRFGTAISKNFQKCDENEGILSTMAQENLTGVRVVRAFGRERSERDRFVAHNKYYTGLWAKVAYIMSRYWSVQDFISGMQVMLVVVFGAWFCIRGRISAGEYVAFISYNAKLVWPVRMLGRMIAEMSKAGVSMDRIRYIMDSPTEQDDPAATDAPMNGDICFDHVNFAYENCPQLLHDVSFTVPAGSTLGILGGTGSGKSTLMLLLDKMYDLPEGSGSITIGGTDIRRVRTEHLRKGISMVLQEPFLFSRSIADNIGIAAPGITLTEIRAAARDACLDDAVQEFTKGYDTFVGERGVTLSGGQKQRAAIARALTLDAPILIFDDSLSAVDTETDEKIRKSLEARFGSATIILISHRISTLSKADKILVLEDGRIAEQGTHDQLKAAGGIYQQIFEIQSGYSEEVDA